MLGVYRAAAASAPDVWQQTQLFPDCLVVPQSAPANKNNCSINRLSFHQ